MFIPSLRKQWTHYTWPICSDLPRCVSTSSPRRKKHMTLTACTTWSYSAQSLRPSSRRASKMWTATLTATCLWAYYVTVMPCWEMDAHLFRLRCGHDGRTSTRVTYLTPLLRMSCYRKTFGAEKMLLYPYLRTSCNARIIIIISRTSRQITNRKYPRHEYSSRSLLRRGHQLRVNVKSCCSNSSHQRSLRRSILQVGRVAETAKASLRVEALQRMPSR